MPILLPGRRSANEKSTVSNRRFFVCAEFQDLISGFSDKLQTEQRQAEQQLDDVRKEIKSEKLEAAKTEAKTALVAKVGFLFGSGKLKELEADNHTLQSEVAARDESIELLQAQMQHQQEEHHRQLMEMQIKYRKEVSLLKTVISKVAA